MEEDVSRNVSNTQFYADSSDTPQLVHIVLFYLGIINSFKVLSEETCSRYILRTAVFNTHEHKLLATIH